MACRLRCAAGSRKTRTPRGYTGDIGISMTLEDCFAELDDLRTEGQDIGLEILANGHIDGYPNPSDAWVKNWFAMCAKYHVKPVEYGHWIDSKLYKGGNLSTKESYDQVVRDIKLANKLGFTCGRTKLGVRDKNPPEYGKDPRVAVPVENWREFIKMALPVAEKYNFRMLPEIHSPALLKSKMLDDYVEFIEKEETTPWFGINVDFGVFQNRPGSSGRGGVPGEFSLVDDMIPLLPYVHCCHAKFNEMNDQCEDVTTPYAEIVAMLVKHNWDGYMLSEYEGRDKGVGSGSIDAVRKQHVMLKRLLGEA